MVVGDLALPLGEDVLRVAAGALGAGQLFVDGDVLADDALQRVPVASSALKYASYSGSSAVAGVDQLPAQELGAVDVDRDRVEHLDVLGVAVEDRVGEHDVVADGVLVVVPVVGQLSSRCSARGTKHM